MLRNYFTLRNNNPWQYGSESSIKWMKRFLWNIQIQVELCLWRMIYKQLMMNDDLFEEASFSCMLECVGWRANLCNFVIFKSGSSIRHLYLLANFRRQIFGVIFEPKWVKVCLNLIAYILYCYSKPWLMHK